MTTGIRIVAPAAFASCLLLMACTETPDPAQLTAVDQLISATDGAMLTLNELDRTRYDQSDSLFSVQKGAFGSRFADTLARDEAHALGDQYLALRASGQMGMDHEQVLNALITSGDRLRSLRALIADGTVHRADAATAIASEQEHHSALIEGVHGIMDNYRRLQHAWDRRDSVALWLAADARTVAP